MRIVIVVLILLLAIGAGVIAFPTPEPNPDHPYFSDAPKGRPEVIAHGAGLGVRPANTLSALEAAASMGADVLEVDAQQTVDGVLVLLHDATLDRTTDQQGPIAEKTWQEVSKADAGANRLIDGKDFSGQGIGVPKLRDALDMFPEARWVIEIKPDTEQAAVAMCSAIKDTRSESRVLVASFHKSAMEHFRAACPAVPTSMHSQEVSRFALAAKVGLSKFVSTPAMAMQVPIESAGIRIADPKILDAARRRNIRVQFWTINDQDEMKELLELGADGIMTDYVERLWDVLPMSASKTAQKQQ
ncbi:MAG: glycerophosphodiester phosphodiesterase [Pseudomonadota bacterium]